MNNQDFLSKTLRTTSIIILLFSLLSVYASAQDVIRVTGVVVAKSD